MDAKPLNLVRPEVPAELAAVVAKMMAKDPATRYQTPGRGGGGVEAVLQEGRNNSRNRMRAQNRYAPHKAYVLTVVEDSEPNCRRARTLADRWWSWRDGFAAVTTRSS